MASNKRNTAGIAPFKFKPGQSGNPGGSAKGYRKALSGAFLRALAEDFEKHGAETIIAARKEDPVAYARIVASLLPKEVEISNPFDEIGDEELRAMVDHLRSILAEAAVSGADVERLN